MTRRVALLVTLLCLAAPAAGALELYGSASSSLRTGELPLGVHGAYFDLNQDTAIVFSTRMYDPLVDDGTIFFGILGAETRTRAVVSLPLAYSDPILDVTITNAEFDALIGGARSPCIRGGYCDVNQDTAYLYTGQSNQMFIIDDTIFFGILTSGTRTRIPIRYSVDGSDPIPALLSAPEPGAALLAAAAGLSLGLRGLLRLRKRG